MSDSLTITTPRILTSESSVSRCDCCKPPPPALCWHNTEVGVSRDSTPDTLCSPVGVFTSLGVCHVRYSDKLKTFATDCDSAFSVLVQK
ncbi:hypothetical protein BaRGS_00009569 [Batillaria attramentaria]|uniref:Uncharacterized protein n=1 Tax=Batillaria attramentaria TaxID=370345 RepID=A0ABD0LIE3_9CAEN